MNATRDKDTRTYRGRSLEEVLPKIKAELGPDAVIVRQRDGLMGGVGGFFQRQCIEVDARAPAPARRFDAYDEDPAEPRERPAPGPVEEPRDAAPSFVPDPFGEIADPATIEGLGSPAIQEVLRQASPFADHLSAASERDALEPAASPAAPAPREEPLPAPARGRPPAADALQSSLTEAGLDPELAAAVVSETVSHLLPFASPRSLKKLVRQALARRIPVEPAAAARGRALAFAGPGGSGKTLCTARVAAAYAAGSDLPVICLALRAADDGAELSALLAPLGVAVHAVGSADEARAHVAGAAKHALVVVDTPAVAPGSTAEVAALASELEQLGLDEVHLTLPSTFSGPAAEELAERLAPLGASRIALTHTDATTRIGGLLDFVIRARTPISFVSSGSGLPGGLEPADPYELATLVLP